MPNAHVVIKKKKKMKLELFDQLFAYFPKKKFIFSYVSLEMKTIILHLCRRGANFFLLKRSVCFAVM